MRTFILISSLLLAFSFAQTPHLATTQQWNVYFEGADGWTVTLGAQEPDGFSATAKSPNFGDPFEATVSQLDAEDKAFLGLEGDYIGFLIAYPTGIVTPSGSQLLLCSLPVNDFSQGQAFGLQPTSTGLALRAAGSACSATLATAALGEGGSWPPQVAVGETWELSLVQNQTTVASWTLRFDANGDGMVVGSATGTNDSKVEASYFRENPPAPNLLNTWVFAISAENTTPFYCVFPQEKPFTANSMTGAVMFEGSTCLVERLE